MVPNKMISQKTFMVYLQMVCETLSQKLFYPLDSRNTKKTKTKMLIFYKQQSYFGQIVSNCFKLSQNNNIISYEKFKQ